MDGDFLIKLTKAVLFSYTTWGAFFVFVLIPVMSKMFMDSFVCLTVAFGITLTNDQRNKCKKLTKVIMLNIFLMSTFLHFIARLVSLS